MVELVWLIVGTLNDPEADS